VLSLTKIANADETRKFRIVMMCEDGAKEDKRIGQCELTV